MSNNEQTAVEWLYHQIVIKNSDVLKFRQYLEQAKEMEKEQKNNLPIHIHEGISNTRVYIENGIVHVKPIQKPQTTENGKSNN